MPGPYTTAADVLDQVQARLNLAEDSPPPEHWAPLAAAAVPRAYAKLIGLLARRGYTPAAVDAWQFRAQYNRDLAVLLCFLQSQYARDQLGEAIRVEMEMLEKELGGEDGLVLFDAGGSLVAPDLVAGGAASGRNPQVAADLFVIRNW